MGTGTDRSNSLHKFTIPQELRWGNQRFLRCAKVNFDGRISTLRRVTPSNSDQHRRSNCTLQPRAARVGKRERGREMDSWSEFLHGSRELGSTSPPATDFSRRFSGYDDGIAATREKVILDLRTAAEEMKDAIYNDRFAKAPLPQPPPPPMSSLASELSRPWNLRRRRADLKKKANTIVSSTIVDATAAGLKEPMINAPKSNLGQGSAAAIDKPMRLRSGGGATASGGKKKERPKFAVALSRREIEEDFYSMVGRRLPGKPKKRNRIVQRQLDTLFPGLWLSEVTANMYKVTDGEGR